VAAFQFVFVGYKYKISRKN